MLIYFLLFAFLAAAALVFYKIPKCKRHRRLFFSLCFLVSTTLLLALRHPTMGYDLGYGLYYGYLEQFVHIGEMSWGEIFTTKVLNYEKGYVIFNKLLSYISTDPQFLIFACAVVCMVPPFLMIWWESTDPFSTAIIYIGLQPFLFCFSGLRQAMAVSITILAFLCLRRKHLIPFVLLVMLAFTFHSTAILFLAAIPLYYFRPNRLLQTISVILIPVIYGFRKLLFPLLATLMHESTTIAETTDVTLFLVFILIYVFLLLFGKSSPLSNFFWVACACQAFGDIYATAPRLGYYFVIYAALAIPYAFATNEEAILPVRPRLRAVAQVAVLLCFASFAIYTFATTNWAVANPYRFFWQEIPAAFLL